MKKQIIIAIILMFSIISCSKDKEQVQPKKSVTHKLILIKKLMVQFMIK